MKNFLLALMAIPFLLISCTSNTPGIPGPPGPPGEDGINILSQIFEVQVDFEAVDDYSIIVDIPNSIEVFDTDVMLAYILTDVVEGTDVWEPLPQTLFLEDKILLYGYNYTMLDVELFLDGTVNFGNLGPDFTDDVVFRIAVIPAETAAEIDLTTVKMVNLMNVMDEEEIVRIN